MIKYVQNHKQYRKKLNNLKYLCIILKTPYEFIEIGLGVFSNKCMYN